MFTMKKVALVTALLLVMAQANATGNSNNSNTTNNTYNDQTYNQGGTANASSHNTNLNTNHNSNVNTQGQQQGQLQGQAQSTENANNSKQDVTVEGDTYKAKDIPVSTAYAPSIAPTANCALSVSAGVQFMGFGGSFGKAYVDQNCAELEAVRSVSQVLGDKETAEAMMCLNKTYAKARESIGRACPVEQE